jgi:hypothetical protein
VTGQARFVPPPGSCGAHVHVLGEPVRYPCTLERSFTASAGQTLAALDALYGTLGPEGHRVFPGMSVTDNVLSGAFGLGRRR